MLEQNRIKPWSRNPFWWQYKGEPTLLIGGSVEDNLFQIPNLEEHLDLLASVGGNYVRCTMSSRDKGNVWPFDRDATSGLCDLTKAGSDYWSRFERFLRLTSERDIIAQIELWDRFDFVLEPWRDSPYNPRNNVNYTAEESGLAEEIRTHAGERENGFFRTVPRLENNRVVLQYQQRQVEKLLSLSLSYGNVLYSMDNETNESPEWGAYWSGYIRDRASEVGVGAETTEMWDDYDIRSEMHSATYDHPEVYTFLDVSQNNHLWDETHWNNGQDLRRRIIASGSIRPINSVKIYGATAKALGFGSSRDGQERFWRNVFGGLASSRFHRPPSGLGLNEIAQAHIRSMRMLTSEIDLFTCEPHNDLLSLRSWNSSYCFANPGVAYAVFFTDGGNVVLDMHAAGARPLSLRWLDVRNCEWHGEPITETPVPRYEITRPTTRAQPRGAGPFLSLVTPREEGYWTAVVQIA